MTTRIPVNPKLPRNFDSTPNEERPASHQRWWSRPYIVTMTLDDWRAHYDKWDAIQIARGEPTADREPFYAHWLEAWPSGTRYDVRCLDGGAWDRSTWWGSFATLEEAKQCAGNRMLPGGDDLRRAHVARLGL